MAACFALHSASHRDIMIRPDLCFSRMLTPGENILLRLLAITLIIGLGHQTTSADELPHIVLVMADDMGWGQTGYNNHSILKTPNLNAMAENGLRFDRFYAAGPVCSPTRASVLTGRTHNRTGVPSHGYALHRQEKTIAQALRQAGYTTGHFGKWHLNGVRGPGVPVLASDPHHPGHFGFDTWLTVTNYFDLNPIMGREGAFEEFQGDSSEIIVAEALNFIETATENKRPSFSVIWYGSPHSPFVASEADQIERESEKSAHHHGELVAMDRSIGTLRQGLKELGIHENTLVWFCSDNGGLAGVGHDSVGGLRGNKGSLWEGGIRVPGIIEWPAVIEPRVTSYPASTVDIFPTVVDVLDLPDDSLLPVVDGISLKPLFTKDLKERPKALPFQFNTKAALIDNDYKIVSQNSNKDGYQLFNLAKDHNESHDLADSQPERLARMQSELETILAGIELSREGHDYPEGRVTREGPHGRFWYAIPEYQPHLKEWADRPEYKNWVNRGNASKKNQSNKQLNRKEKGNQSSK
nr:sulfatase-like hydrolase/transferase [Rubinisphaera sp. JC750]